MRLRLSRRAKRAIRRSGFRRHRLNAMRRRGGRML